MLYNKYVAFVGTNFKSGTIEEVRNWATKQLRQNAKVTEALIYELVEKGTVPVVDVTFTPVEVELPLGDVQPSWPKGHIADAEGRN